MAGFIACSNIVLVMPSTLGVEVSYPRMILFLAFLGACMFVHSGLKRPTSVMTFDGMHNSVAWCIHFFQSVECLLWVHALQDLSPVSIKQLLHFSRCLLYHIVVLFCLGWCFDTKNKVKFQGCMIAASWWDKVF